MGDVRIIARAKFNRRKGRRPVYRVCEGRRVEIIRVQGRRTTATCNKRDARREINRPEIRAPRARIKLDRQITAAVVVKCYR